MFSTRAEGRQQEGGRGRGERERVLLDMQRSVRVP